VARHEHERRTDEKLKEFVLRFHSRQNLGPGNGLSSAVTEIGSVILSAQWKLPIGRC
jgi:hypothetical protein